MVHPFAFISAYKLAWYEGPVFLISVLGFGALCFVVAIVSALRHWRADRGAPAGARLARRLAAALALVHFLFFAIVGISIATNLDTLFYGFPTAIYVALALPLLAIPLTLGLVYLAYAAWRNRWWTRYGRVQYAVIAVASVAFLWLLNYANLIGYRFG
jgi:hypothetical protein